MDKVNDENSKKSQGKVKERKTKITKKEILGEEKKPAKKKEKVKKEVKNTTERDVPIDSPVENMEDKGKKIVKKEKVVDKVKKEKIIKKKSDKKVEEKKEFELDLEIDKKKKMKTKDDKKKKIKESDIKNKEFAKLDPSFVPAYKKKDASKIAKRDILYFLPKSNKKRIVILSAAVIVLALLITGITLLVYNAKYSKYFKYEEKMHVYGFDRVYDNGSAKTSEEVTKSEAIKMILAAVYNVYTIDNFAVPPEDNYNNGIWVEYAEYVGVINEDEVNKENGEKRIPYIDMIRYFANAKQKLLNRDLNVSVPSKITNIDTFKIDEKSAITDMAINEIIENIEKDLNGKQAVFKGLLNEMVINFVEKYNTITINGQKLNINPDKVPSNADDYPYILSNVSKEIYEIPNYKYDNRYMTAKVAYADRKEYYTQIDEVIQNYISNIVNVNYETINADTMYNNLLQISMYSVDKDSINRYVEYVKTHKIKISGTASVQYPAVYYDGISYRVRTKITYQIHETDTRENLLFGDLDFMLASKYEKDTDTVIIDIPMGRTVDTNDLYVAIQPLALDKAGAIEDVANEIEKVIEEEENKEEGESASENE